jgi:hypothetical protein
MPYHITEGEIFKKGSFVTLNTGEIAEVIDYEYPQSLSPYIDIYINSKKEIVRLPIQINLEYDDTRYITQVIEDENAVSKLLEIKHKIGGKSKSQKETIEKSKEDKKKAAVEGRVESPGEESGKELPIDKIQASSVDPSVLKTDESALKK